MEGPQGKLVTTLILPYGEWAGHPEGAEKYGPEEGRAMLAYWAATAKKNGKPIVIDYEHQTLDGEEAPAAGWIWDLFEDLTADPPGIYARNEWTPRAAAMIQGNEYRYISPVIAQNYIDPVSGETVPWCLFNAALTNIPFMADKMKAVQARMQVNSITATNYTITYNTGTIMDLKAIIQKVMKLLGLADDDDPNKVVEIIQKFLEIMKIAEAAEDIAPVLEDHGDGAPPPPDKTAPEGMQAAMRMARIAHATKNASRTLTKVLTLLNCKSADVLAVIGELKNGLDPTRFVPHSEFEAIRNRLAQKDAEELIAANAQKIQPADRAFWINEAKENLEKTKAILAKMPNVLPAPVHTNNAQLEGKVDPSVQDEVDAMLGVTAEHKKYRKQ